MPLTAIAAAIFIAISGIILFRNLPINESQPTVDKGFVAEYINKLAPSPSSSLQVSPQPVKPSTKPTSIPSPSPSASPSPSSEPSSEANNSPTPTPSPEPGVYKLSCGQNCEFTMNVNSGYSVGATLQDSNGKYIPYQSDFEYIWSLDDPTLGVFQPFDTCLPGVYAPCPLDHAVINAVKKGSSVIRLKVKNKSDGKIVGETNFNVKVN